MSPRNTTTGGVLEAMVVPALLRGGYEVQKQVDVGERLGGGKHFVDAVASKNGQHFLVSLKWQQTSGTAEEKVPFEMMCLADALRTAKYSQAYLVLGGDGWKRRDYFISGSMVEQLKNSEKVHVMTLERFTAFANDGRLGTTTFRARSKAVEPMMLPKVDIESPFRGDETRNVEFCKNICRYAVLNGFNPYAMHLFFTQFLDDSKEHERDLGIKCGLAWTDHSDEIWFCLRPGDEPSSGMMKAVARDRELVKDGKVRILKFLQFTQEGELVGKWQPRAE
jgi:hypothetical protein